MALKTGSGRYFDAFSSPYGRKKVAEPIVNNYACPTQVRSKADPSTTRTYLKYR